MSETITAHEVHVPKKGFEQWYQKWYRHLLILPVLLFLISLIYLVHFTSVNGDMIYKDVSLTGGTTITVFDTHAKIELIRPSLISQFPDLSIRGITNIQTSEQKGFFIESKSKVEPLKEALESILGYKLNSENSSIEFSHSSISEGFYKQLRLALVFAFIFMAIVVFLLFRSIVPSGAVILSAFADIIMTIVTIDILGFQLSTAGIIALLMLIGYSVDTDILLTSRLIKYPRGKLNENLYGAFKTGMTMTLTAIAAVGAAYWVTYGLSDVLEQMFSIILIGLGYDIFNTWITNASILKWYIEVKHKK